LSKDKSERKHKEIKVLNDLFLAWHNQKSEKKKKKGGVHNPVFGLVFLKIATPKEVGAGERALALEGE
jgi:hypothetical protein